MSGLALGSYDNMVTSRYPMTNDPSERFALRNPNTNDNYGIIRKWNTRQMAPFPAQVPLGSIVRGSYREHQNQISTQRIYVCRDI